MPEWWNSTAIVGETAAPMQAASPTAMNAGNIESYLISNNGWQQMWNPKWMPWWMDEALSGHSLDEQIDIINKRDRVVDNTNRAPNFMDAWALQRELWQPVPNQQYQQQLQQQQQTQQQQTEQESELSARITALEQWRLAQMITEAWDEMSQDPNNREELSYEEWQEHWNEYNWVQQENADLKAKNAEYYKNNLAISWENDILKSTIWTLQWELKDTKSKLAYLESTANIVNDAQEVKLLNLRRAAAENQWWAAELNYINLLQQERQRVTGQDLSQNINDLYFSKVQRQARPEAVDYDTYHPTTNNQTPQISNLRDGDETKKNPGSLEDYLL